MSGAVKSRTPSLSLAILNFAFPNWGDDANKNMRIIDGTFSAFGITISGAWDNGTAYVIGSVVVDTVTNELFRARVAHVSNVMGTFEQDRLDHPSYWEPYTSEAASVGQWTPATAYFRNNVVFDGYIWAIANKQFVSSSSLAQDIADNNFVVIVDNQGPIDDAIAASVASNASAVASENSAIASAASALASLNSANASAASALAALNSQNASAASQVAAAQSVLDAAAQVVLAAGQVALATAQATNAANSATAAAGSANASANSATASFNEKVGAEAAAAAAFQSALDAANNASSVNFSISWNGDSTRLVLDYNGNSFQSWPVNILGAAAHATTATAATDSENLGGKLPNYYTAIVDRLGYTPIEQGGGTGMTAAKLRIGLSTSNTIYLQTNGNDHTDIWPIHITGNAGYAATAGYASDANNTTYFGGQLPSYYTAITTHLGYIPVRQMQGNIVYIGWDGLLNLQVNSTYFGATWPINITGAAASVPVNNTRVNIAAMAVNDVGTYVLARIMVGGNVQPGMAVAGSNLRYAASYSEVMPADWLPGTWICCGYIDVINSGSGRTSLFRRIN